MKKIAIIPARSGSKGIKNKNIKILNNHPLIYYTINSAIKSKIFDRVIVTTDSKKIAKIANSYGAETPFIRPKYLSSDRAKAIPTIKHALKITEKIYRENYDLVCMLQPTSPLRRLIDYKNIFKNFISKIKNYDSSISVVSVNNFHPIKMKVIKNNLLNDYKYWPVENPPRQSLPKVFIVNGCFYLFKREILLNKNSFKGDKCLPFIMKEENSLNIDSLNDFELAKIIIKRN